MISLARPKQAFPILSVSLLILQVQNFSTKQINYLATKQLQYLVHILGIYVRVCIVCICVCVCVCNHNIALTIVETSAVPHLKFPPVKPAQHCSWCKCMYICISMCISVYSYLYILYICRCMYMYICNMYIIQYSLHSEYTKRINIMETASK